MPTIKKYKFYKNKRTKYHPSIEICVLEDGTWENIEITTSPTETGNYEVFDVNPNPNSKKKSYFRRYLRKDKIRHRGEELKKYQLVISNEIKIDVFVSLLKNKNGGKLTNKALSHKGHTPSMDIKANKNAKIKKWIISYRNRNYNEGNELKKERLYFLLKSHRLYHK